MATAQSVIQARKLFVMSQKNEGGRNMYNISFPHPNTGATMNISFRDNIPNVKYANGVSYKGTSLVEPIPLTVFQNAGLTPAQAKGLKLVAKHEGNFDAINSWDSAIFSWGFIQFAGGVQGSTLGSLLLNIKIAEPRIFEALFGQFGIDVVSAGPTGQVSVMVPERDAVVKDNEAWTYIKDNKILTAVFIRAGNHPTAMVKQIEHAVRNYAIPALKKANTTVTVGGQSFPINPLSQVIRSEAGQTALIDITVNQWISKTGSWFKNAIEVVGGKAGIKNFDQLLAIDEKAILTQIVADAQGKDKRIVDRMTDILNSGLSFSK